MKIKYKILILLTIILLSVSVVNAANIENNYTNQTNQKTYTYEHSIVQQNTTHSNKYTKYQDNNKNNSKLDDNIKNKTIKKKQINFNKNKTLLRSTTVNSYSYKGILSGANRTTNFINNNHRLPAVVGIDGKNVNMNDFLYLLCKSLNSTSSTTLTNYSHVSSTTGTNCNNVKIYKKDYLTLSNEIIKCYDINKRNPKDISLYSNTISYDDAIYFYARAVAWKYNHKGTLPNYGTVIALYNNDYSTEEDALIINTTTPFTINSTTKQLSNGKYNLTLKSSENCTIYYTTDGTTPTNNSTKYARTLTISNDTVIKYYGINKNKQKTPVLTYGIYQPSTPYITNKPQLEQNGYENKVNIATSQKSTIYYTINGTKPTTQSTIYTQPLTIHNNTLLQYFTITEKGKKSPTYYYKLQNPTPYVTILNNTEVDHNYQNIKIIANKPGTIYYTRNGTLPTNKSNKYNASSQLNISIKTQINAILQDKQAKKSENKFYQAPQIITLPIVTVNVYSYHYQISKTQRIYFRMDENQETYYTTDNTNPKNSSTRKIMKYSPKIQNMCFNITNNTIVKYYTKDTKLNITSNIYTYKPLKNQSEEITITILNTTPLYTKGAINTKKEEKVKIAVNGLNFLVNVAQDDTDNWNSLYDKEEYTLNNTSKIIIETPYMTKIKEYTLKNGLRTRMNYTYTMKIPYQKIKFTINNTTILNLNNKTMENKIKNGSYLLYDYSTKTCKTTSSGNLTKQGILINIANNTIIIKTYDYTYGDVNQVSITKEWVNYNTIKVSSINNGMKKEIGTLYMPSLDYIDCYFISNNFYKSDYIHDYLSSTKINNNRTLESVETYILTNQKITYDTLKNWTQKYSLYNKSVYKSCYGTFLTGLTHLFLHNAMMTVIDHELNITSKAFYNTQMRVAITCSGHTSVDIDDGSHGTIINSNNESNFKIHNFLNGYVCSYLEDLVLYMAGDNNSGSAYTYFVNDVFNYKTINFTYDNNTGQMKIHTQGNNDYYIIIYADGSTEWAISNHRDEIKTLKMTSRYNKSTDNDTFIDNELNGGSGTPGYGYNYESTATDILSESISSLDNILSWGSKNLNLSDAQWETFNFAEDQAGSILIGTGICLICASGVGAIPIALIAGGCALCYFSTGVNEVDDFFNPYYYIKGAWSISAAVVTGCVGGPVTEEFAKITATTITKEIDKEIITASIREALARNNLNDTEKIPRFCMDAIEDKFQDWGIDYVLNNTERIVPS